jgi:hypothetical protein
MRASHDLVDCMRCTHERLKRLEQFFVVAIQRDDKDAKRSNATIVDRTIEWERQEAFKCIERDQILSETDDKIAHALTTLNNADIMPSLPQRDSDVNASLSLASMDAQRLTDFKKLVRGVCDRHTLSLKDWVNAWKCLAAYKLGSVSPGCFQAGIRWIEED